MDEECVCGHPEFMHSDLGFCEYEGGTGACTCLRFHTEAEDLEDALASGDEPDELDFDHHGDA